jgi:penicillin-binding protein 1A
MEPYYIERVVRTLTDQELYRHYDEGVQVLDEWAALRVTSILKGVLTRGTARRTGFLSEGQRPAAGKTGTQEDNTNAWFVGYTPQLTTAVWVGNPKGYVPMVNVPEFVEAGVKRVQGSTFPAAIWKAFMEPAHVFLPIEDWPAPPDIDRDPMRLFLPGVECLAEVLGPNGRPVSATTTPDTTRPRRTTTTEVDPDAPTTTFLRVRYEEIDPGTTVPSDVLDPHWPLPMASTDLLIFPCTDGLPTPPRPPRTTVGETTTSDPNTSTTVGGGSTTSPSTTKPPSSTTTSNEPTTTD